ncbi:UDP-N-acetylmuramoyl-L-alanyl-D-glutamate--2,6-diaminopimelate ligase [Bifidobacterium simiarum]|uniref:UDP-N-acetylmuramoyl-L-alanyl-D-glutamate--2, 6-diaminopimelate ligase n=1 Tax=Bifidobacterium simiarum TaxID=2045441 RepID=A0A2M9HH48_9BIFI|nr:UDP-N-acetylmuramoyl-L-alanyl-D-glutamate--2,6-diaminopimelate ligase [Bifidobacterium simiarum]PJM76101.1 UDP-N-acetylmuramoyl-L-alanyl-D-glutamate--2,6-diaminopimelate ligase [Bifidobacterium simiarum]
MALTLASAARLLTRHHLLREIIQDDRWSLDPHRFDGADTPFEAVTYDTRTVSPGSLLFCKGRFRSAYLDGIDDRGLAAYVAQTDHSSATHAVGLIVNDVRKAMSLLSAEFYGRPQDELTVIGITGTKGKTTTNYFTQAVLNAINGNRTALFSSVDNCVDGHTYVESDLTTPESLDAFRMMRQAVDHGMTHLVMEVSSQAYKVDRVYGLTFDVAAFLNISPDHISPIEHPTFEDYLHCKRQIVANAKRLVLGADCAHADLIREDAAAAGIEVSTFALHNAGRDEGTAADVIAWPVDPAHSAYEIAADGRDLGTFHLRLDGDFNYLNAAAAVALVKAAGFDPADADVARALHAMESVRISGRMEQFRDTESNTLAIVDYAHNFASVSALLDFIDERYGAERPRVTVVTGSAGDKAVDRRKEIVDACQHRAERLILTFEDTDTEPVIDVCRQMLGYVTDPNIEAGIILDRTEAIETAVADAREHCARDGRPNVIMVIGKGEEQWMKDRGRHVPYEGDTHIVSRVFKLGDETR